MRMFDRVLLPAPFSQSSACTSPWAASKSTRSLATTPGKRFVIPRIDTAGAGGPACAGPPTIAASVTGAPGSLAGGAALDALDEPVHRIEIGDRQLLALRHPELPALVVERAGELVERAVDDRLPLRSDLRLRRGRHLRAVRRDVREPVLDRAV